jgi:hypothetical protein
MDKFNPSYLGQSDVEAATEATLEQVKADTDKLDIPLSNVSVSIAAAAGLTNAQLRATPVPVSSASLPLPTGASTEATLALIKAKTDNIDVALSTRTKPADAQHSIIDSGTVTANAGTNLNTSALALDATLTGGSQKAINRGGAKGATTAADITSTANGVDHQGLDVQVQNASIAVTGTFWQATQPVSGTVTANAGTNLNTSALALDATLTGGTQQSKITDGTSVATVKAASTAAAAADKALVVAISPNNTVPVSMATAPALVAGSAIIGKVAIDQTTPGTTNAVQIAGGAADATNVVLATAIKLVAGQTYTPTIFKNLGANATLNVKASAGNVFSLSCYNSNVSSRFIQIHNTTTTPGGGATPIFSFLVPPSSQIIVGSDFFTMGGIYFSAGIAFAFSTTINTYTAGVAGEQSTFIQYV